MRLLFGLSEVPPQHQRVAATVLGPPDPRREVSRCLDGSCHAELRPAFAGQDQDAVPHLAPARGDVGGPVGACGGQGPARSARHGTPSAAAEMVVGEKAALIEGLLSGQERLGRAMLRLVEQRRAQVERLAGSYALTEPRARLFQAMQRRDELVERLDRAMRVRALAVTQTRTRVEDFRSRLGRSLERSREGIVAERRHVAVF